MGASVWTPGTAVDANNSVREQAFIASASQTDFTFTTFSYVTGTSSLRVYVSGVRQRRNVDYVELSSTQFRLTSPVPAGTIVIGEAFVEVDATESVDATLRAILQGETGADYINFRYSESSVLYDLGQFLREFVYASYYGATGDGVTDNSPVLSSILADFPSGNVEIIFSAGEFVFTDTALLDQNYISIRGSGTRRTIFIFAPTGPKAFLKFSKGVDVVYGAEVSYISITNATSYDCTAIELSDISSADISRSEIYSWTGTGIQTKGREVSSFWNLKIDADLPIRISENPNSNIDCNEFCFRNLYLIANDTTGPCITADDGVFFTGATWEGYQSWVHGKYGFYWRNTTDTSGSQKLTFRNIWKEQSDAVTGYVVYIENIAGTIQGLTFDTCHGDTECNGYYLRGVLYCQWNNCLYPGTHEVLNVDGTVINMAMNGFHAQAGSTATLTGQTLKFSTLKAASGSPFPDVAQYQSTGASNYNQSGPIAISAPSNTAIDVAGANGQAVLKATETTNNVDFRIILNNSTAAVYTSSNHNLRLGMNNTTKWEVRTNEFAPFTDNSLNIGSGALRPATIYAFNGVINTSDRNAKTLETAFSEAELRVARKCKPLIKKYKMIHAVEEKGNAARWHFGAIAQDIKAAFESEGLNAFEYGVLCYDEWEDIWEDDLQLYINEDGTEYYVPTGTKSLRRVGGNIYGIRYEELLAFIIAAL